MKKVEWNESIQTEAIENLLQTGKTVVSPTKVGYIIMATDIIGLEKKFDAKQRKYNKPAVVLCSSIEQLKELAKFNEKILELYQMHWNKNILLGCILPWSKIGHQYLINTGTQKLVADVRQTSCFVIKFGIPSELIVKELWDKNKKITFASSANPSGFGNKGKISGIGNRIENSVDLIISADDYVKSIQPNKDESNRYEQGVMVSLVDHNGQLINFNSSSGYPTVIRKGLDINKIMLNMSEMFNNWDYRHGQYY